MNAIITATLAGIAAAPAWIVTNLLVDFLFLPVIRRHSDQLNDILLARPGLNLVILAADVVFWGAVFGAGYGLLYPGLAKFGSAAGLVWGGLMFVSFSRAMVESSLWTKVPRDMNLFWFMEGLLGLLAWGVAFEALFTIWI